MSTLSIALQRYSVDCQPVVPFNPVEDRLMAIDLTQNNRDLTQELVADTEAFSKYLDTIRETGNYRYLIGGYGEHRSIYSRSAVFDLGEEPRRLHLGLDIWGEAGTPVMAALDGRIHSKGFNNQFGDYGATLILSHEWRGFEFFSLYGHLAEADLHWPVGEKIPAGRAFAHVGRPVENGGWPPHLHVQLIIDMGEWSGDYPGVCRFSERAAYLANCPDPDLFCQLWRYV